MPAKEKKIYKATEDFLLETDLDKLSHRYAQLNTQYTLDFIYDVTDSLVATLQNKQGLANILMYPQLLRKTKRYELRSKAFANSFGPYVFLSAILGIEKQPLNIQEIDIFCSSISRFFNDMKEYNIANDFSCLIVQRIASVLFLHKEILAKFDRLYEYVLFFLQQREYVGAHHNLLLSMLQYDPSSFSYIDKNPDVLLSAKQDAKKILKIYAKKEKTYQDELQLHPVFSPIPSFQEMENLRED